MGAIKFLVVGVLVAGVAFKVAEKMLVIPPIPAIDPNPWWGPGQPQPEDTTIKPFKIKIPENDVEDLKARLGLPLRLTPPLIGANFTYGMSQNTLEQIVTYWKTKYNWTEREKRLNQYPHFKTRIEGLDIHFLRASAKVTEKKGTKVVPLLLIHGWPGSFVEFYSILPLLTKPQDGSDVVFEVICPSIPGYGFSQSSAKQGLGLMETSQIFLKLMKRLGYDKFYLQGGDWGAIISNFMATMYPDNILGVHLNMVAVNTPGPNIKLILGAVLPAGIVVAEKDQDKLYPLGDKFSMIARETGYLHLQATKPDTVGAALNQSPVGLASYILEKFSTWTHQNNPHLPDGGLLQKDFPIPLDELLDNICVYWFTGSITSSMRYYAENFGRMSATFLMDRIPCEVPAGIAVFPQELLNQPKNFIAHKFHDIVTYTDQPAGGHFAAMERPQLLAADIHKFVSAVEKRR
uniref:Epoxide hydrolase n=1 Tax=Macrobrachium rosenbergii TaxID=79674 RepID=A0A7T1JQH9_MACRS|nr:juvenile hormone epoxide hydrolase [Macrobrachium rosenbergii]